MDVSKPMHQETLIRPLGGFRQTLEVTPNQPNPNWKPSVVQVSVGDVADEANADLLVVSSEAVHSKKVDANLLAEFVPCPLLLLP